MTVCHCGTTFADDQERCSQCWRWKWKDEEDLARAPVGPPAPAVPAPPVILKPTREQVMAVKMDAWWMERDGDPSPWQMYGYAGWSIEKRRAARTLWKEKGMTHVSPTWCLDYPASGMPAFDLRSQPDVFGMLLAELKQDGFIICLPLSQEEAYGTYEHYDLSQNLADIERWPEWGWSEFVSLAWPGWESNDFMTATQQIEVLRQARTILGSDVVLGVQPGRSQEEPRFWAADVNYPEAYDKGGWFTQMHDARISLDVFLAEPSMAAFYGQHWRERLYSELMGVSARVYQRIDPVPNVYPFPARRDCRDQHELWTRCPPIQGGGVPLVYWEGPAWDRWSSARKAEATRIALMVPGVIGYGDGMVTP